MSIAFVGSREENNDTDQATYSITPFSGIASLAEGQLAVMFLTSRTTTVGATSLSGWTLVETLDNSTGAHKFTVWSRVIQAGDTTSTSFTFDPPGTPDGCSYVCNVYSGVDTSDPFINEGGTYSATDADRVLAAPTQNNTLATSWWVAGFGSNGGADASVAWSANAGTERNDIDGADAVSRSAAMYDSNGTVAVGNVNVTGTLGSTTGTPDLGAWLGILRKAGFAVALAQATETDTAAPVTQPLIRVAQATEADTAQAVDRIKPHTLDQATETDTAHDLYSGPPPEPRTIQLDLAW